MPTAIRLSVPITLTLKKDTLDRLTAGSTMTSPSEVLSIKSTRLLEAQDNGGCMLTVDQLNTIEAFIGKSITNGADVVDAALKGGGVEDGKHVFQFRIDPQFLASLEETAHISGRTVEDLISEMSDVAMENNWWGGVTWQGTRRTFFPEEDRLIGAAIGKEHWTVEDLCAWLATIPKHVKKQAKLDAEPVEV